MPEPTAELVTAEHHRLRDALAGLPDEAWGGPSLCEGWTPRHVLAHLTMPARYGPEEFGTMLREAGFDFTAVSNRVAAADAGLPLERLLDDLVRDAVTGFRTPEGGVPGALSHVVVHGLDITVPAGRGCVASDEAVRAVLELFAEGGVHRHFGASVEGRRLVADDLGWSWGSGEEVVAPAHVLVLALAGRTVDGFDLRTA